MKTRLAALAPIALLTACTTVVMGVPPPAPIAPDLRVGAMGQRTAFETTDDGPVAEPPGVDEEDLEPNDVFEGDEPTSAGAGPHGNQRARTAVFWTGIALAAAGGAGVVGLSSAGYVAQQRIDEGYERGMTRARAQRLQDAGENFNRAAIASAGVALVGIAMAAIAFGLDYTACGKLTRRRADRDCPRRNRR